MADSVEQSKWGKFIGETTAITIAGAVLYFWGRAYFDQLIRSSGFPAALFEISIYDLLFSTWLTVLTSLIYVVGITSVWYARHFWAVFLCWILVTLLYLPVRGLLKVLPPARIKAVARPGFGLLERYVNWLKKRTPDEFLEKAKGTDENAAFKCGAALLAIALIFGRGAYLEQTAKKDFEILSASPDKREISVRHQDGKETIGQQVVSLGGNVILDVTNASGQINRVLVRGTDIKQVTQLPLPPPKEPSISAVPASK
jgi:hypothetical protein